LKKKLFGDKLPYLIEQNKVSGNKVPSSIPPNVIKNVFDIINSFHGKKLLGGTKRNRKQNLATQRIR